MLFRSCEGATIGPGAIINQGLTIGRHALITAGSVVTKDVPDYALMTGNPAQMIGRVCPASHRMTRQGRRSWYCDVCDETFKVGKRREDGDMPTAYPL